MRRREVARCGPHWAPASGGPGAGCDTHPGVFVFDAVAVLFLHRSPPPLPRDAGESISSMAEITSASL